MQRKLLILSGIVFSGTIALNGNQSRMVTNQRLQRVAGPCRTGKFGQTIEPKEQRRVLGTIKQSG